MHVAMHKRITMELHCATGLCTLQAQQWRDQADPHQNTVWARAWLERLPTRDIRAARPPA